MTDEERAGRPDAGLRPRERVLAAAVRLFLEEGIRAVAVDDDGGSLVTTAAIELRRVPDHPAWRVIAGHRTAVRQLLEDLVKPLEVDDPPAVAARLQRLVEGAEALAAAGEPAGALDLRVLADAVRR